MRLYAFDADGVIFNSKTRDEMIHDGMTSAEWDAYHEASIEDDPHIEVLQLIEDLSNYTDVTIEVWTARPEKHRPVTQLWLDENGVEIDELKMRPDGDWRPAAFVKLDWLHEAAQQYDSIIVFDDSTNVVKKLQEYGAGQILQMNHRDS